tara:strand:+ start:20705 stop:20950 length:246 start_codon:yes stop_codon:yes gene_type:complete
MEKLLQLYNRLRTCREQYKSSRTKTQFSHIWVECAQIEQDLDAIELYNATENKDHLHTLRKKMLVRLGELQTSARAKYNNN